jgi:hypothetical protein
MATDSSQVSPSVRQDPRQVTNTLRKTVNFNDPGITTGVAFDASLPKGAFITQVLCEIVTTFNAGTTNVLTVGTNATNYNNIIAAADVNEGATGVTSVATGLGRSIASPADVTPFVMYTQTGTAATQGQAVITITYEGGWSS